MNWKHHQKMVEDVDDEQFLQEEGMEEQPVAGGDQVDPLDAFMNDLNQSQPPCQQISKKERRFDAESDNDIQFQADNDPEEYASIGEDNQQFLSNEQEPNPTTPDTKKQKKIIESLKPFDFSKVDLKDFDKNFYEEHPDITNLTDQQIKKYMKQLQIKVTGMDVPRPIVSFGHLPFDQHLKKLIVKNQFEKPTPIQSIALPAALSGRDIVGIAKTGSGKTLAYVWPMIIHVSHQQQANKGDGPIAIVMAPTRQLCQQIFIETKKYSKKFDIKTACLLGGQNKHEQWKTLKAGVDILIASPGRCIQMLKKKAINLVRVTYLVLDEADRMLSLGFQQQIRSIISQTRQDRQTLLFTATMKKSMQFLVNDIIISPVRINIGEQGAANQDVKQEVVVIKDRQQKFDWFFLHFRDLVAQGKVLVFANQRQTCEQIGRFLQQQMSINALVLHGDKNQYERTMVMNNFKGQHPVLVATDIAARGIDVKNIKSVVNFQCPKQIQAYIHRIGRAGRAGETGISYTFLMNSDSKFAIGLVKTFENSGYPVPQQLQDLACLDDFFKRKRLSSKMGVSFAKGKDASKFLNQIIKKQRIGFSRAGLGMQDPKDKSRVIQQQPSSHILSGVPNISELSVSQLSALIRQKHEQNQGRQQKFGQFVLSSSGQMTETYSEPTITFSKKSAL